MKLTLAFAICLFAFSGLAQETVNQYDEAGKRHGVWKKYFSGTKQLRYQGQFDHGKEVGTFKFYCEECKEQPSAIKEFSKNDAISQVTYYTAKGKLVSKGKMDGKKRIGEWVYFHKKSNEVMTRENYVNGKLDGKHTTYFTNGKITEELTYKNGLKEGDNNYYAPEGTILKKLIYSNDKLHGPALYYDAYGNVTIKGQYKQGKKEGLWLYYKNGKVELEETYPKPKKKQ